MSNKRLNPKILNKILHTYEDVFNTAFEKLMNDELLDLFKTYPETLMGIKLWFDVIFYATASASNDSKVYKNIKPSEYALYFLANKCPSNDMNEYQFLLKEKFIELSNASKNGEILAYINHFHSCLSAYNFALEGQASRIASRLNEDEFTLIQGEMVDNYVNLWENI